MTDPSWEEMKNAWVANGLFREVFVPQTTEDDWQRVVAALRDTGWGSPTTYNVDGDFVEMPNRVSDIFQTRPDRSVVWCLRPSPGINVICHFFEAGQMEFEFDPAEVRDQAGLDLVCDLMRIIGHVLRRPVFAIEEAGYVLDFAILRYDPSADRVIRGHGPTNQVSSDHFL